MYFEESQCAGPSPPTLVSTSVFVHQTPLAVAQFMTISGHVVGAEWSLGGGPCLPMSRGTMFFSLTYMSPHQASDLVGRDHCPLPQPLLRRTRGDASCGVAIPPPCLRKRRVWLCFDSWARFCEAGSHERRSTWLENPGTSSFPSHRGQSPGLGLGIRALDSACLSSNPGSAASYLVTRLCPHCLSWKQE